MIPLLIIAIVTFVVFATGWHKATLLNVKGKVLLSRPIYFASYCAITIGIPLVLISTLWLVSDVLYVKPIILSVLNAHENFTQSEVIFQYLQLQQVALGILPLPTDAPLLLNALEDYLSVQVSVDLVVYGLMLISLIWSSKNAFSKIKTGFNAREKVERYITMFLGFSSLIAIVTTLGIVFSLLFETLRFFKHVPFFDFVFGTHWSPQMALREDQAGSSGAFGAIPLFSGSLLIAMIAMLIAVPIGLFSAIYLAEYAQPRTRSILKPLLEILAGIPTVVYGFFAALTVAPMLVRLADSLNFSASSESALAAGLVMGVMIIPFISSLSEDVISAVPQSLRDGSLAMGATKAETITNVILPAALPGIVSSLILAFSRAIGETMIVVMAAGLAANLTINPLESVTTITAQIVTILVGDQSFDSPKTLAAFALGLALFCVTLLLNILALKVVRKYREQYD